MKKIVLNGEDVNPLTVWEFCRAGLDPKAKIKIEISPAAKKRITASAKCVLEVVKGDQPVYSINTGFGIFAETKISRADLLTLQRNIILSHATGMGEALSRDLVLAMWVLRINTACRGHNGITLKTLEHIIQGVEAGMLSVVPSRGSVGASGDLCPSAHATLPYIGEGLCTLPQGDKFVTLSAPEALKKIKLPLLELGPKEGLSLINGTQLTTALAIKTWAEGHELLKIANLNLAMMIEAMRASHKIFHEGLLRARNQPGALACGKIVEAWIDGPSEISESHRNCAKVQDSYSLRCAPQVHGAVLDDLNQCEEILRNEVNAATDNPLIFVEGPEAVSGGNFHAIYSARVSDRLCSAFATLANISERRIFLAMNKETSGLPPFLVKNGGLNSGFMTAQYTAAALVSEAKAMSFPASVDSIPTNGDREDHVSMGPIAGFKALRNIEICRQVLAIELLSACQALDFLRPLKPSKKIYRVHQTIRQHVAFLENDRVLSGDLQKAEALIRDQKVV